MRTAWPDALSAIRWACEVSGNPGRPYSSRMLDAWREGGDSTDAAGQAGLIFRTLGELKGAPMATLVAAALPMGIPCHCRRPCCSGRSLNPDWREAVDILAAAILTESQRQERLRGQWDRENEGAPPKDAFPLAPLTKALGPFSYPFRVAAVHRVYGARLPYHQIRAELPGDEAVRPDIATLARHGKEVEWWLGVRHGGDVVNAAGVGPRALERATELLREAGLLTGS